MLLALILATSSLVDTVNRPPEVTWSSVQADWEFAQLTMSHSLGLPGEVELIVIWGVETPPGQPPGEYLAAYFLGKAFVGTLAKTQSLLHTALVHEMQHHLLAVVEGLPVEEHHPVMCQRKLWTITRAWLAGQGVPELRLDPRLDPVCP